MGLDLRYDNRLMKRNVEKGVISEEEYKAHLEGLADASEKLEVLELEQPLFFEREATEATDEEA